LLSTSNAVVQQGSYKISLNSDLVNLITLKSLVYLHKGLKDNAISLDIGLTLIHFNIVHLGSCKFF